ncbi:hypothetical protein EZ428_23425 [Pedobacter frigiditerrae]|uniref:Carboxypeptidase regulatory-like domain-containing protein n=1 Tax=Pedobacter frigiditerrae TaxID=2530452 RepID=A0A4R0MKC7_9SPHI|nr:hypothetical protein [Pedobacter frigiditerrae]TCC86662.1 hypothetical protein EZ428_23425 [Pedobacter frigiditerrae]
MMRFLLIFFLFCVHFKSITAQENFANKMEWLAKAKPTSNLFVHFDKNIYANKETAYFTGYLIKEAKVAIANHSIMAVALIRNIDSTVVLEDKFLMENGFSFGNINIPDSILTGSYHFLVYTDKLINGLPEAVFHQSITIKTNIDPAFKASIKIATENQHESKNQRVLISVTSKDNRFLPKLTNIIYRYGNLTKKAKTDASGQFLMTLPLQGNLIDPNVYVKLKYEKDSSFISLAIPQPKSKADVKFYPEGGNLISGLPCIIGWEVKDQQKMPIALNAYLYKNNLVIDTIETSTYGMGKFRLIPEPGVNYSVKLIHSNLIDSSYALPKAIDKGLTINIQNALVIDTLNIYVRNNGISKLNILIHNFKEEFLNIPFDMEGRIKLLKIPLTDVPKGLTTLTILDSLNRPLAERMFFAHHDMKEKLDIEPDKNIYSQREKVSIKLKLMDIDENAVVSIACVQANRMELKKTNDIESYVYLKNELVDLPVNGTGSIYKDKIYLEQILLIKGWRRYTWQDLLSVKLTDTTLTMDSLKISGFITRNDNKKLPKPLTVGLYGNRRTTSVATNEEGLFKLNNVDIIVEEGEKMYAFLTAEAMLIHTIKINDPYTALSKTLVKVLPNNEAILPLTLINNSEMVLNAKEKPIRLKEVVINTKKNEKPNAWNANKCGDYVCFNKILNCRNHGGDGRNTAPIVGKTYFTNYGPNLHRL